MSDRDELIEVGAKALWDVDDYRRHVGWDSAAPKGAQEVRETAAAMVDAVEPIIREDERERMRHWSNRCRDCGKTHYYEEYDGERRAHMRTTGMAPATGYQCICGRWVMSTSEWHDHLTGVDDE